MSRRVAYLVGLTALVGSGASLFLYLFKWEWNRALIAGLFFVALEIGLLGALILERLRRIESRIDDTDRRDILQTLEEHPSPRKEPFAWLTSDGDNLGVFIPFLLGAGLVVSALAWLVERVAHVTATPVLDRRLAARLAPIALPRNGFMGMPEPAADALHTRRNAPVTRVALWLLAALVGVLAIVALADATQTRTDTLVAGSSSAVMFELASNGSVHGLDAAASLWSTCWGTVPSDLSKEGITHVSGGLYMMTLEPALGPNSERRLRGCMSDATIDNIRGRVVSVTTGP